MLAEVVRPLVSAQLLNPTVLSQNRQLSHGNRCDATLVQQSCNATSAGLTFCTSTATEKGASQGPLGSRLAHSALCKPPQSVQFWLGKATRASTSLLARRTRSLAKIVFSGPARVSFY